MPARRTTSTSKAEPPAEIPEPVAAAPAPFDLDALVIEAREQPFVFTLGGRRFTMRVPEEFDWLQQSALVDVNPNDYRPIMRHLLGQTQYERFVKIPLPQVKIEALLTAWYEHHGIQRGE